jgi:hypothetical protein
MQHSFGLKRLGWVGDGGWRAVVIKGDPGGDSCGNSAVVSPTDNEVVLVGGGTIGGGNVGGADR